MLGNTPEKMYYDLVYVNLLLHGKEFHPMRRVQITETFLRVHRQLERWYFPLSFLFADSLLFSLHGIIVHRKRKKTTNIWSPDFPRLLEQISSLLVPLLFQSICAGAAIMFWLCVWCVCVSPFCGEMKIFKD